MNREQKNTYVNDLKTVIAANEGILVYHYEGITVKDLESLRAKMRESGAFLKITKNRITKIALKGSKAEKLEKFFKGPTAIACSKDPITLAKTLVTFSKGNEKLKILGGLMDEKLLEPSDVAHIATLPTLNEARKYGPRHGCPGVCRPGKSLVGICTIAAAMEQGVQPYGH